MNKKKAHFSIKNIDETVLEYEINEIFFSINKIIKQQIESKKG